MSAYYNQYMHSHLNLDATQSWMDDDGSSILDDNILDGSLDNGLDQLSPVEQRRQESYMEAAIYSPSRDWTDFDTDMGASMEGASPIPAPSFEHSNGTNNPFIKLEAAQPFSPPSNVWGSRTVTSGAVTPAGYDAPVFGSTHFDTTYLASYGAPAGATYEPAAAAHITPNSIYQAPVASSLSSAPAVVDGQWPAAAIVSATPNEQEARPITKRMRPQSPPPRSHSPLNLRRDGIRKKNARFDIPAERTLLNIDNLIAQSADDQEIKELKQQKRLLRNRQAALDSRQRKKQHTERLEEEKKIHSSIIAELEEKVSFLTLREEDWRKRLEEVTNERDFARHQIDVLQIEKEEMIKNHTLETRDLRKEKNMLESELQRMESLLEQSKISSGNVGGANFGEYGFDDSEMSNFWSGSTISTADPFDIPPPETKTALVKKSEAAKPQEVSDADKPAASGLLFLLLLCGAFVASSSSSQLATSLPPLPQPVRAASAGILQNIFQDAGVSPSQGRVEDLEAGMTESWTDAKSSTPQMVGLESSVAMLNAQFQESSLDQDPRPFMGLSISEYNDVTSKDYMREPEGSNQRGRKHLADGLASMRRQSKPSLAEVYTRSLLWDKVDAEVVRRFAVFAQRAAAKQAAEGDGSDLMV